MLTWVGILFRKSIHAHLAWNLILKVNKIQLNQLKLSQFSNRNHPHMLISGLLDVQ